MTSRTKRYLLEIMTEDQDTALIGPMSEFARSKASVSMSRENPGSILLHIDAILVDGEISLECVPYQIPAVNEADLEDILDMMDGPLYD